MDQHAVCVLPDQQLDDDKQIGVREPLRAARSVAAGAQQGRRSGGDRSASRTATSSTSPISTSAAGYSASTTSAAPTGDGNQLWHTDSSFRQKSATWSMLHARIIPPDGADTEFADTRAAYDALPEATKAQARRADRRALDLALARASSAATRRPRRRSRRGRRRGIRWCGGIRARAATRSTSPRTPRTSSAGRSRKAARCSKSCSRFATQPRFVYAPQMAARRSGDLGQPLHPAPRDAVRVEHPCPRHAPQHRDRRARGGDGVAETFNRGKSMKHGNRRRALAAALAASLADRAGCIRPERAIRRGRSRSWCRSRPAAAPTW